MFGDTVFTPALSARNFLVHLGVETYEVNLLQPVQGREKS